MVSSLISWDHSVTWAVAKAEDFISHGSGGGAQLTVEVDISSEESKDYYLIGHTIDGRVLFPATGYLVSNCLLIILYKERLWIHPQGPVGFGLESAGKIQRKRIQSNGSGPGKRAVT